MLLEASISNSYSYNERQTISLVASSASELVESNVAIVQAHNQHRVLRSAAIYGANASGKSNLLHSLYNMRDIVLSSSTSQRGELIPVTPFKLNSQKRLEPSEFELIFIAGGIRYQYGFSATTEKIYDEWLFAFPKGQAQLWFQRAWNDTLQQYSWRFGNYFFGEKTLWQRSTRDNALFLSTAVQLNSSQLQPVFDWFKYSLRFIGVYGLLSKHTVKYVNDGGKKEVLNYLQAADIKLHDIFVRQIPISETLPKDIPPDLRKKIIADLKDESVFQVKTHRLDNESNLVEFNLEEESDGTQRFFGFIGPWLNVLASGAVLFVDELDNSLHTDLVRFLIKLFNSPITNPKNAQLIFTTHDTNQLDQEILRRDQIWFCERDGNQATKLYPLTDFSPRKNRENLEASYLSGRFGALPFVAELEHVNGT